MIRAFPAPPIYWTSSLSANQRVIIGVGNPFREDDGIGPAVIAQLRDDPALNAQADLYDGGTDGLGLIPVIERYTQAIIVDAVRMGLPPGTIKVFTPQDVAFPIQSDSLSTHGFGLAQVMELLPQLGNTTALTIVGIEPESVNFAEGLSPAVKKSLPEVVRRVYKVIVD